MTGKVNHLARLMMRRGLEGQRGGAGVQIPWAFRVRRNHLRARRAVVLAGNLIPHRGHQQLVDGLLHIARAESRDAYAYISADSRAQEVLSAEDSLASWKLLYPDHTGAFRLVPAEGDVARKISLELERHYDEAEHTFAPYHDIVFVSGETEPEALRIWLESAQRRLNADGAGISRGAKISLRTRQQFVVQPPLLRTSDLVSLVLQPDCTEEDRRARWRSAFDARLSDDWVYTLLDSALKVSRHSGASEGSVHVPEQIFAIAGQPLPGDQIWKRGPERYLLRKRGDAWRLVDMRGRQIRLLSVPNRYVAMWLEEDGFRHSDLDTRSLFNGEWFRWVEPKT
jgi:hypothetical protein